MKKIALSTLLLFFAVSGFAQPRMSVVEAARQADSLLSKMTLDEKISMTRGYSRFFFNGIERLGIPYIYLSDASQGVNMRHNLPDPTMVRQLEKSTAFPCPIMLAATFNPALAYDYARSIGEECRAGGVEVLLGPGLNIYRNSQCGRNFEYFGEDPFLTSRITENYVQGMQSTGTAACLKHFLANNTEFYRRRSNSILDERTMREIYLPGFEAGIAAGVACVMTSYNRINGEWAGQSKEVITDLLRGELGFEGLVMTDWNSVYDMQKLILSGQNVEMPGSWKEDITAQELLSQGKITEADIDAMIRPLIATCIRFGLYDRKGDEKYKPELLAKLPEHEAAAYRTSSEGIVLLRNDGLLPLKPGTKILAAGQFLDEIPRGAGSAAVKGYNNVTLRQALEEQFGARVTFAEKPSKEQFAAADVVLISVGTLDAESIERPFALPSSAEKLVQQAVGANPRTVVLVNSGSGIRMTGWGSHPLRLVSGTERIPRHRESARRRAEPVGQTADNHRKGVRRLSGQRNHSARRTVLQRMPQRTAHPALRHSLYRGSAGRLPLVRHQGHRAALPLRARALLHHLRAVEAPPFGQGHRRRRESQNLGKAHQHGHAARRRSRPALRFGEEPGGDTSREGAQGLPQNGADARSVAGRGVRDRLQGSGLLVRPDARMACKPRRFRDTAGYLFGRYPAHAATYC